MIENLDDAAFARVNAQLAALASDNERLSESLDQVRVMVTLEDEGWKRLLGGPGVNDDLTGITLEDLKKFSKEIRAFMVGQPLIENAANLRSNYVWSKGIVIPGSEKPAGQRGALSKVARFVNDPVNRENFFSAEAHDKAEHAAGSDGNFYLLGDEKTKTVRQVPVWEFTAIYTNPDFPAEVWAYRRQWQSYNGLTPKAMDRWIYTDRYQGKKQKTITVDKKAIPVEQDAILFDQKFNAQAGWALGVPDLIAAVAWAKMYSDAMKRGKQMTDAMAQIAYKAVSASAAGANNNAVRIAGSTGAGNTASMTVGNDLVPLATAGRGYDFTTLRPIAAMIAAAAQVSTIDLLADPSASGSSYGSAATLDPPKKRAMIMRQNLWVEFFKRVLKWGTGADVEVFFGDVEDPDYYRQLQGATLAWQSGLLHPEEARALMFDALDIVEMRKGVPEGILVPNNEASQPVSTTQAASPDQGKSTRAGKAANLGDQRNDIISK